MTPVNQIKRQLARFAASELSLEDFQRWLDNLDASRDSAAIQLKHAIEWQFCDAERGVVNESGLLDNLEELAATPSSGTAASGAKVRIFVVPGSDDLARYASPTQTKNCAFVPEGAFASSGSFVPCFAE